jgi:hypothetical protein
MTPALPLVAVFGLVLTSAPKSDAPDTSTVVENLRVQALFESMRKGDYVERGFPKLALSDVPALLEYADSTRTFRRFPVKRSSLP